MITGFLGNQEILLAAYDDGDVKAYHVDTIAAAVAAKEREGSCLGFEVNPEVQPTVALGENVGSSAWGLAIHQKSRLIAVSSNRHEVTVFAPGLTTKPAHRRGKWSAAEGEVRQRDVNWRIVVSMGRNTSNIPNLCFIDDEAGQAEKICAIDINGAVWIADIWSACQPLVYIPPIKHRLLLSEEFPLNASR